VKNWKSCERRIAEELGGVRVPVSGRSRGDAPDVDHPSLSIEVKSRKKLPAWLLDAIAQAEGAASPD
jgi:Holliday junction resolvase